MSINVIIDKLEIILNKIENENNRKHTIVLSPLLFESDINTVE